LKSLLKLKGACAETELLALNAQLRAQLRTALAALQRSASTQMAVVEEVEQVADREARGQVRALLPPNTLFSRGGGGGAGGG
jgi:hypothetical protein